tara:strand:- start:7050 stop:8738 length:1689 start_codon:yes stop_codon:yes gene_type:complete
MIKGIFSYDKFNIDNYGKVDNFIVKNKPDIKVLDGDLVEFNRITEEIVKVIKKYEENICGVLEISSKVNLGLTKNNVFIKRFIPYDSKFPNFRVSTKIPYNPIDKISVIKYNKWDKKIPDGQIISILGNIGDYDAEIEYIKYRNNFKHRSYGKRFLPKDFIIDKTPDRYDMRDRYTVSIDPLNCDDIDDAISYFYNDYHEIGIHIADVTSYFDLNHPINKEMVKRSETIYYENKKDNLLPIFLSCDKCSLLENLDKRAFSIIFKVNNDGTIIDYEIKKTIINVNKNFSYEVAQRRLQKNKKLNQLYDITKKIYLLKNEKNEHFDTHILVETLMILCNSKIAEFLIKYSENPLLRVHKESLKLDTDDIKLFVESRKSSNSRAFYKQGKVDYCHRGLNEKYYTHFTSPIRRYFDQLVHREVYNIISKKDSLKLDICDELNLVNNKIKKIYNELYKLKLAKELYDNSITSIEIYGFIIDINKDLIKLYLPDYKISINTNLFSYKIKHLFKSELINNSLIVYNSINKKIKLELYERLDIKLIISFKNSDYKKKLQIQIKKLDGFIQ